jgi:predicted naringenin-chalcone synthase
MAERAGIEHRYSFLEPAPEPHLLDESGFYRSGAFPGTAARMRFFEEHAHRLARDALRQLRLSPSEQPTHLIVGCCTGFFAPGLDWEIAGALRLGDDVERTNVGFMGCQAAMNALKLARHIVRSEPGARILVVNLELCTLHLQETGDLEQVLSFLVFADGCAAALVSAEPVGLARERFASAVLPESEELIRWRIGERGFDMRLSGEVPNAIGRALPAGFRALAGGRRADDFGLWAVHPGGRSVLDAVERGLDLPADALAASREVLRCHGNMSSPTILFVLKTLLEEAPVGEPGCALAFGPGLSVESLAFHRRA